MSAGDPVEIAGLKGLVAGVVNLGLGLSLHGTIPRPSHIAGAALVGFIGYGVSLVLYVLAMRDLGTARTGAYFSAAPFVGALVGLLFFREPITPVFMVAALLMGVGLRLHLTERHDHAHVHEPIRHTHRHHHDIHHQHAHHPDDPQHEPHVHEHEHTRLVHGHPHFPDIHHRHEH